MHPFNHRGRDVLVRAIRRAIRAEAENRARAMCSASQRPKIIRWHGSLAKFAEGSADEMGCCIDGCQTGRRWTRRTSTGERDSHAMTIAFSRGVWVGVRALKINMEMDGMPPKGGPFSEYQTGGAINFHDYYMAGVYNICLYHD